MSLDSLPTEIILNIASFFSPSLDPLNSLCQTNKRFHTILERALYTEDVQHHQSSSIYWAAGRGNLTVIRKAISLGKAQIPTRGDYASVDDDGSRKQPIDVQQRRGLLYGRPMPIAYWGFKKEHPICRAAQNGHDEAVRFLLDEVGCSPHIRDGRDFCLVSIGILGGLDKETIQTLLDRDVHQYARTINDYCPLDIAAFMGNEDLVGSLLSSTQPIHLKQQLQESFQIALLAEQIPVALQLLDHDGVNLNSRLSRWSEDQKRYMPTPLGWAVFHGYLDLVEKFLDKGADADFSITLGERLGRRVLFDAVERKQTDMVDFLVRNTTDRVTRTKALSMAVHVASSIEDPTSAESEVVEILLRYGVSCNFEEDDIEPPLPESDPQSPGWSIACSYRVPEKKDGEFIPPIVYAVHAGNLRLVQLLLSHGADVNTSYRQLHETKSKFCCGRIFDLATDLGHREIADFLLESGAKLDLGRPPYKASVNCGNMYCPVWVREVYEAALVQT
jgi:ankyrin repeat protein